jgi:predicted RNA-binding protein with RPS1 domain
VALKPDPVPVEGSVVPVYVANASSRGCFLRLTSSITGKVLMRDLSDDFVPKPEEAFPVGKLCQARLLSVSQVDSEAKLSLKESAVLGDKKAREEIKKVTVGSVVQGTVQRVTQDGVFVALKGTSLTGLSRRAAAISDAQKSLTEEYEVGDVVRCKVLSVSKNSLKVGLGLRAQYFKKDAVTEESASDSDSEEEVSGEESEEDDSGSEMDVDEADSASGSDDSEQSGDEEDDADSEEGSEGEESEEEGVNKHIRLLEEGDDGTDDEMEQMIRDAALRSSGSEAEDSEDEESDSEASEEAPVPARKGAQAAAKKSTKAAAKAKAGDSDSSDDEDDAPVSSVFKRATVGKTGKDVLGDLQWDDSAPLVVR